MIPLAVLLPAIAGIMVVEIVFLMLQPAERRRRILPTVTAGLFIVLAWTLSVFGVAVPFVLTALTGALIAHSADLYLRW